MTPEYRKQLEVLAQRARAESLERGRQTEIANAARIQREIATLLGRVKRDNSRKNRRRERALAYLETGSFDPRLRRHVVGEIEITPDWMCQGYDFTIRYSDGFIRTGNRYTADAALTAAQEHAKMDVKS